MYNSKMDSKKSTHSQRWANLTTAVCMLDNPETQELFSCKKVEASEQHKRKNGAQVLGWGLKASPEVTDVSLRWKAEDAGIRHPQVVAAAVGTVVRGVTSTLLLALSFSGFRLSESLTHLDGTTHILGKPFPSLTVQ